MQGYGNAWREAPASTPNARDFPRSGSRCSTPPRTARRPPRARLFRVAPPVFAWSAHRLPKCSTLELAGMDVADRSIRQGDRKIRRLPPWPCSKPT